MPRRPQGDQGGKLRAVARRWAGGRGGKPVPADDPLTASSVLPKRAAPANDDIELAPDEAEAASLFLALGTQWRRGGMEAELTGLDYAAIEPTRKMLGIEPNPQLLHDLRVMEASALAAVAEKRR